MLFAGEVFAVKHLRSLLHAAAEAALLQPLRPDRDERLHVLRSRARPFPEDRLVPYPIGKTCSHLRCKVVDADGREVRAGDEGELCVAGRGVMQGYWALPEQTARAFLTDDDGQPLVPDR